ncbi:MAG: cupin domain-containing protein [Vicinamibacterales bacterium]
MRNRLAVGRAALVATVLAAVAAVSSPVVAGGQPSATPRISLVKLLENESVMVTRITFPPGAREAVHITPQDLVVMQGSPGQVEVTLGNETTTGRVETGKTWWVSNVTPHAYSNVGTEPFDLIVIFLKQSK